MGIERLVRIQAPDSDGPFTNVEWIEGNSIIAVTGRASCDDVIAVAEGIEHVASNEFAAAGASSSRCGSDRGDVATGTAAASALSELEWLSRGRAWRRTAARGRRTGRR